MNQDEHNHFDEAPEAGDEPGQANAGDSDRCPDEAAEPGRDQAADADQGAGDDEDASRQLAQMKEAMLRLKAEMDNREKRLEREMNKTRKFALEALMRDLVQVLDSMDQALASGDSGNAPEGMELVRKQAVQVLSSHGLEMLDPEGEKFDPSWHEAMSTQPSDEHQADTIVRVLQKGYRLNDRLIRPARVIVASGN